MPEPTTKQIATLNRWLGIEPVYKPTLTPAGELSARPTAIYPPIDAAWTERAMEAATRKAGILAAWRFEITAPSATGQLWGAEVTRDRAEHDRRSAYVAHGVGVTQALALFAALDAARVAEGGGE